jgi:hypothetical protein
MQLTQAQMSELRTAFTAWRINEIAEGRPYPDAGVFDSIASDAVRFGAPLARSAFARAVFEAAKAGKIRLHQPAPPPPDIDDEFRDAVQCMPASELRKKINTDATFKAKFDELAKEGSQPQQQDADDYSTFKASDWRALPQETLARLMSRPAFRKRIDELAAAREI